MAFKLIAFTLCVCAVATIFSKVDGARINIIRRNPFLHLSKTSNGASRSLSIRDGDDPVCTEEGFWPVPGDCYSYIVCVLIDEDNNLYQDFIFGCDSGYHYCAELDDCVRESVCPCEVPPTTTTEPTTTSEPTTPEPTTTEEPTTTTEPTTTESTESTTTGPTESTESTEPPPTGPTESTQSTESPPTETTQTTQSPPTGITDPNTESTSPTEDGNGDGETTTTTSAPPTSEPSPSPTSPSESSDSTTSTTTTVAPPIWHCKEPGYWPEPDCLSYLYCFEIAGSIKEAMINCTSGKHFCGDSEYGQCEAIENCPCSFVDDATTTEAIDSTTPDGASSHFPYLFFIISMFSFSVILNSPRTLN